jgi:hypothetical protein
MSKTLWDWLSGRSLLGFEGDDEDARVRAWLEAEKAFKDDAGSGGEGDEILSDEERRWPEEARELIRKERQRAKDEEKARKAAEKERRDLQRFKDEAENKDKTEVERAKAAEQKATDAAKALRERLRQRSVDFEIHAAAQRQRFRDPDDAVRLIDRDAIEVDEDEDEGTIDVDRRSVDRALEALAKAKPHLVRPESDDDRSGSKFNGPRGDKQPAGEEALKKKYAALNG